MGRIVTKEQFQAEIRPELKSRNKTIVLCHGVFDLLHPGHVIHFEQAKKMGDILVVSVTAAKYVRKGPDRPYFNDEMRMKVLSSIQYIDYVILSDGYTVDDIIEAVEPDIYVKGQEYAREEDDITGKMKEERELVERHGGSVRFTRGQTFSSTKLINTALSGLSEETAQHMKAFKTKHTMDEIRDYADRTQKMKVLVIGDVIIDKYTYCSIQGLMSKDMGYSAQMEMEESYLGGSAAIARHLASFSEHVSLMSIIGSEEEVRLKLFDEMADTVQLKLLYSSAVPTIVKHRYLTKNQKREEYRKIFAVNNIRKRTKYEPELMEQFKERLASIDAYDVVFLCDFGHGLIDRNVIDIVEEKARCLVLNCQTNSSNYGLNLITKYKRADAFSLDQTELKLAYPALAEDESAALKRLSEHLHGRGWLTRGSAGAYQIESGQVAACPAFTLDVKDTIGAGDAFFAVAGIFAAAGAPAEVGTFVGNIGGALGANIVGNKSAIEKVNVLKYANTLMNI